MSDSNGKGIWTRRRFLRAAGEVGGADCQIIVAGDQVSYLPGWQEGAMLSAHHVLRRIAGRDSGIRMKTAAVETVAPQSRAMTEGAGATRDE